MSDDALAPVMVGRPDDAALTRQLLSPTWDPPRGFGPLLAVTGAGTLGLFALLGYTAVTGVGLWGNQIPVAWGFAIINFVWWIGIGHAGTFISAVLLLLGQRWRASINRFAEAMTLCALVQAGIFPLIHLGRPWFAYWLVPYPSTMGVWPQFRSALPWDAAAITTYLSVSIVFWYMGLIPDLAAMRDRAPGLWRRRVYGVFALGWRGGARQWSRYRVVYGLLAGLATPLVVSVHSIVSTDFAESLLPGWHSTIFPVYFVVGAVFSGFAMVLALLIPARRVYRLHDVITARHLDALAKLLVAGSMFMSYSYVVEAFTAWYGGDPYERYTLLASRPGGSYAWLYWTMIACNCVAPLALWSRRLRASPAALMAVSLLVVVGMWVERFVLIVTSQWRDFLPSSWALYTPTWVDGAILLGTISCFAFLFLLFLRWVPIVPLSELKSLRRELTSDREEAGDAPRAAR